MVRSNYDPDLDILTVDADNRSPEDYERSIPVGDYIIDVATDGEVLGIEVLNASKNLPYAKSDLEEITAPELKQSENADTETVTIAFRYGEGKGSFSVGYPASA